MELTLDLSVARAGVSPALNLQHSYTKNADILLNDQQKEGLALIRTMLGTTSSAVAIPQLISMMEKTETNEQLLIKMKDWFALMNR
jgi:transcription termination factor Rho